MNKYIEVLFSLLVLVSTLALEYSFLMSLSNDVDEINVEDSDVLDKFILYQSQYLDVNINESLLVLENSSNFLIILAFNSSSFDNKDGYVYPIIVGGRQGVLICIRRRA